MATFHHIACLAQLVAGLLGADAVHHKAALGIIHQAEVLVCRFERDELVRSNPQGPSNSCLCLWLQRLNTGAPCCMPPGRETKPFLQLHLALSPQKLNSLASTANQPLPPGLLPSPAAAPSPVLGI